MCERSEFSARLLTTEVLALSYLLRAAQDYGDHFQKQLQPHKQQSSEFRINPLEPSRLADERETAQKNRQMYRQKNEDEREKSDQWSDAALESEKKALQSQAFLHDFISEQPIPSRSDETVPVAWQGVSNQHQLSHTFSNIGAQDGESTRKRKEMDKIEFEQGPHLPRL